MRCKELIPCCYHTEGHYLTSDLTLSIFARRAGSLFTYVLLIHAVITLSYRRVIDRCSDTPALQACY